MDGSGKAAAPAASAVPLKKERRETLCMISRLSGGEGGFSARVSIRNTARQHFIRDS